MRKADNLPPSCAVFTKSRKLNVLEPSGPLQACNETDLPLPLPTTVLDRLSGARIRVKARGFVFSKSSRPLPVHADHTKISKYETLNEHQ